VRRGLGIGERRRGCSGWVGGGPASDSGRGEGRSSTLRPTQASVRDLGHPGPKFGMGRATAAGRRGGMVDRRAIALTSSNSLQRSGIEANGARVPYLETVLRKSWHGVWSSGRFGTTSVHHRRARAAEVVREVGCEREI
jgi:hypothetical protein